MNVPAPHADVLEFSYAHRRVFCLANLFDILDRSRGRFLGTRMSSPATGTLNAFQYSGHWSSAGRGVWQVLVIGSKLSTTLLQSWLCQTIPTCNSDKAVIEIMAARGRWFPGAEVFASFDSARNRGRCCSPAFAPTLAG